MALSTTFILSCRCCKSIESLIYLMYNHLNHHIEPRKKKRNQKKKSAAKKYPLLRTEYKWQYIILELAFIVMHLQMHVIVQVPWCLCHAPVGHTLIQTKEVYEKRGSVCPALQGGSAGVLGEPQPINAQAFRNAFFFSLTYIWKYMQTSVQKDTQLCKCTSCTHGYSCSNTLKRQTLISSLIMLTISWKQDYIIFKVTWFTKQPN